MATTIAKNLKRTYTIMLKNGGSITLIGSGDSIKDAQIKRKIILGELSAEDIEKINQEHETNQS